MKCIQSIGTGNIRRVDDDLAREYVNSNVYRYVNKELWKEKVRDAKVAKNSPKLESKKEDQSSKNTAKANRSLKGKARKNK